MSITSESWWGREVNAPALVALGEKLRVHYRLSADAIGIKGNAAHTQGYHRSANWVHHSAYCTSGSYSVTETPGNRNPADADWCCALDVTLPHDELLAACQRLDEAVRAGDLEKVTEWYGNKDGDQRVDGYDNIRNAVASSDDSHLWHMHLSFDRKRVAEDHTDVYEILTGEAMALNADDVKKVWNTDGIINNRPVRPDFATNATVQAETALVEAWDEAHEASVKAGENSAAIAALDAKLDQILAAIGGTPLPPAGGNVTFTGTGTITPA